MKERLITTMLDTSFVGGTIESDLEQRALFDAGDIPDPPQLVRSSRVRVQGVMQYRVDPNIGNGLCEADVNPLIT